jgi:hypothetical protein
MSGSETVDGRDVSADGTKLDGIEASATADQTSEEIQDIVGAMVAGNTESGITVTYQDGDGTIDFAVATQSDVNFTSADHSKLDGIEASATADQTAAEIRALVESASDSNAFADADHSKLNAIEASADVTDTTNVVAALTAGSNIAIAGDGTISATDTDTNTQLSTEQVQDIVGAMVASNTETGIAVSYEDGDGTLDFVVATQSDVNFTSADHSKLDGIEASATADQTAAEVRALVESATDSNVFVDADHSKLNAIEASATADQTAAEIRTLVESATDSNVFADADHNKLNAIESSATADQTDEEIQDIVGAMLTGNTESGITVAYQDGDGTIDFTVTSQTDENFTSADHSKLDAIEASATADQTAAEIRTLVEAGSDSNVFTDADHTKLNAITASADVTLDEISAGTNIGIDSEGVITATDTNTQLSTEQVQDIVGAMVASNTETGIAVTYEDGDGTLDFVVATQSDVNFTSADHSKLDGIEASATADQTAAEIRALVESASDSNAFADADHSKLNAIEAAADVTDTTNVVAALTAGSNIAIAGDGTISATDTDTNTQLSTEQVQDIVGAMVASNTETGIAVSYEDGDGTLDFVVATQSDVNFTSADHSKLDGIEASATADQTAAEVRALVESASDSNAFTDADHSKLNAIEASATADQTDEEIEDIVGGMLTGNTESGITVTYQDGDGTIDFTVASQTDENFTSADHSKLDGIEASATADQTNAEIRAAVEAASDSNVFTDADHTSLTANNSKLSYIEAGATADQTSEEIQDIVGAMVTSNTESGITVTYQDGDGTIDFTVASQTDENFTSADHTALDTAVSKLSYIEAGATADQTNAEIRTAVEAASDSNVFTDADHTKLNGLDTVSTLTSATGGTSSTYSYTLVLGDQGNHVALSNLGDVTLTVPTNSSVAFPTGTEICLFQENVGQVTITAAYGVTLNSADSELKTRVRYSSAILYKVSTDTWLVAGDLTA